MLRMRIWQYLAMIFIGALPVLSVLLAGLIASINGCRLDEGSAHVCMVWGRDIGGVLYTMTVIGWLGLISGLLVIAGLLGLCAELILAVGRRLFSRRGG